MPSLRKALLTVTLIFLVNQNIGSWAWRRFTLTDLRIVYAWRCKCVCRVLPFPTKSDRLSQGRKISHEILNSDAVAFNLLGYASTPLFLCFLQAQHTFRVHNISTSLRFACQNFHKTILNHRKGTLSKKTKLGLIPRLYRIFPKWSWRYLNLCWRSAIVVQSSSFICSELARNLTFWWPFYRIRLYKWGFSSERFIYRTVVCLWELGW